jgi:hypothetical protein
MPYVGIRKTAGAFKITAPNLEKSATVLVPEEMLPRLIDDPQSEQSQEYMMEAHRHAKHKPLGRKGRLFSIFQTENTFWYIHLIVTLTTLVFGVIGVATRIFSYDDVDNLMPVAVVPVYAILTITVCLYSLYALFKQRRAIKRRSALLLFVLYLYFLLFFGITGIDSEFQFITTMTLAGIAFNLFIEWSRPSRSGGTKRNISN